MSNGQHWKGWTVSFGNRLDDTYRLAAEEKELRETVPALKEAWEKYQMLLALSRKQINDEK